MIFRKFKYSSRSLVLLIDRLDMYTSSGLTLNRALDLCLESGSQKERQALANILKSVENGMRLSDSMHEHLGLRDPVKGLLYQGENSGELSRSLRTAKILLENKIELIKKCTSAMIYPIVIGLFASLLTIGLIRGVMPQIVPMLKSLKVDLPLITRLVIKVSDITVNYGFAILAITVSSFILFVYLNKKSQTFKHLFQKQILRLPIIGSLISEYHLSIFLLSIGSLVSSGSQIHSSYISCAESISLLPLKKSLLREQEELSKGKSLGMLLSKTKIPSFVPVILRAGELSGSLGDSAIKASNILNRNIDNSLKRLTSLVEPLMMVLMGSIVGGIALSIMLPIYDMSRALQR